MKNRIKILLSFMFLVSMFLIFQGCQKETFSEPQNDSKYVTRKVTFDDIKNKPELSKPFKLLKNVLDFNAKNKSLPDSFVIETDQIIEVIAGNKISYSFKILNPIDLTSVFENFIIDVSDPQNTKYFIFQYKYKKSFEKGEFPFDVTVNNLSEYQIEINNFQIYLHKWIMCIGYQNIISPRDNPAYDIEVLNWWDCSGGNTDGAEYVVDMSDLNSDSSNNNDSDSTSDTDSYSESGNYHDNTGSGGTSSSTSGSNDYVDPDGHAGVNFSEIEYVESILTNLTDEQIAFLYNPNNDYEVSMIAAFLSDNKTPEAVSFAKEAFVAMMNDGEVDYLENIIITMPKYPCQENVVFDAFAVCSPLTKVFQQIFENDPDIQDTNYGITYKIGSTVDKNGNTAPQSRTIRTTDGYFCSMMVTFNENYISKATDLSIARTTIHETLHATILYMLETGLINIANPEPEYAEVVEAYVDLMINNTSGNTNPTQHQYIASLVKDIANSLSQYGQNKGYNLAFSFYEKMAWGGLQGTQAFKTLYPEFLQNGDINPEYFDIINTLAAEQDNSTNYYNFNGDIIIPKGGKPNSQEPCN